MSNPAETPAWAQNLAEFLRSAPGLEAVRVDPTARKVSVATLGTINEAALRESLRKVLAEVEARVKAEGNAGREGDTLPTGFSVRRDGGQLEMSAPTCATAPTFWTWREFSWPDPEHEGEAGHDHEEHDWRMLAGLAAACGVAGIAAWVVERFTGGPQGVVMGLAGLALITGGWDAAIDSWENIRRRKLDIHFLMLAVAVGAVSIGAWAEAVLLLFLFSASGAMEAFAMDRTHREVDALLQSAPKHALRIKDDGEEEEIPVDALRVGDRVRVKPGAAFPADGHILTGKSACDESTLTGESVPVEKAAGDDVFSGTLNLWGAVTYEVERLPAESTLQKIIRLIQTAQKLRAPSERFTDKFGGRYTLLVLGVCAVMFLVWWLVMGLSPFTNVGEQTSAFYRAMTLLVVMSPCALVLSIPSAVLAAIAWGARHGVLFRGGAAIEKLAEVQTVAMDKTGTLTTGELKVVSFESLPAGRETEVMELALALEANSQHPIARAIVRDVRQRGVAEHEVTDFSSLTGQGVRGTLGETKVLLGRRELLDTGPLAGWAEKLPPAEAEFAEVWIVSDALVGRILLRDELRSESAQVLTQLHALGLKSVMLTGDRRQTAEKVAAELGVGEVRAGLTPEGKVDAIEELKRGGRKVAMVGDGVNDAPSLAAADVSVAMGARGSDAALEQAEVILMEDRIENVLSALRLSRRAKRVIKQNLAISLGVVVVMAIASVAGVVPLGLGVAAHEGSTVLVCLNSLRLLLGANQG
ncbi:heavy metal translocating P-type ATPase [Synoicihabitans lomoniglobus]|uniref:Cation-translocating P-type ATPase n=1 Tax=Synoicihabitans lomoniglobus TaxID=2909285 RepID=A0AAF0CRK0_9BACT|nr:cation-translocating P-type ATPase [Opitutaceae bacterium LMO-M01]WED66770.1 cation-translocating P-type ATPase [Opitutaceae bacterium LMO-M01]